MGGLSRCMRLNHVKGVNSKKISAVTLVRNEEHNIRFCLETLLWCDEIVVVDMESTDTTVAIAREYTDCVFSTPKLASFDLAKKFAVEQATGDWILLIDADEMVSIELSKKLRVLVENDNVDVVEIPFMHYIMGDCVRHSGWGYEPLLRFFRRDKVVFTGVLHNYMQPFPNARLLRIKSQDENCIVHFNYVDSVHFIKKLNRYTTIEAQYMYDKGVKFSYRALFFVSLFEFFRRFLWRKGYKDGVRGFALCFMMFFYRVLSYIKLWEKYSFCNAPVINLYNRIREGILARWKK